MSTEADIVERLEEEINGYAEEGLHEVSDLLRETQTEITKLRAERDAAGRDMQERAAMAVRNRICTISWPPEDGDELIDELMAVVRALPLAVVAMEGHSHG